MQWQILSGIYTNQGPDFRVSYPVNMAPVPKKSGISNGFLRPADGLVQNGTPPGLDRGGINWRGICYRVSGEKLISVAEDGSWIPIGTIPGTDQVTMDYSFDRLAIAADGKLFYSDGGGVTQVTDPDLGTVLSVIWIDGYFMTTDGESLVVTELTDPLAVDPLKYGSSEVDPDPVVALRKIRDEAYAVNRYTVEVFDNVAAEFFPFQRIDGAQIQKGCVGPQACCIFLDRLAMLGGGRNEAVGIYLAANGGTDKLSTQEMDELLLTFSDEQLQDVKLEAVNSRGHWLLYVHLPDRTVVYDAASTQEFGQPVWFTLTSSLTAWGQYRARSFVFAYQRWLVADPTAPRLGYTVQDVSTHYGDGTRWEFGTIIAYNEGSGAQFHQFELVVLPGSVKLGVDPYIATDYSLDGRVWSQPHTIRGGSIGNRNKRWVWLRQGFMRNWRIQRFRGTTDSHPAVARLEATVEALAW